MPYLEYNKNNKKYELNYFATTTDLTRTIELPEVTNRVGLTRLMNSVGSLYVGAYEGLFVGIFNDHEGFESIIVTDNTKVVSDFLAHTRKGYLYVTDASMCAKLMDKKRTVFYNDSKQWVHFVNTEGLTEYVQPEATYCLTQDNITLGFNTSQEGIKSFIKIGEHWYKGVTPLDLHHVEGYEWIGHRVQCYMMPDGSKELIMQKMIINESEIKVTRIPAINAMERE